MGDRRTRLLTVEHGECPFQLLPIPLPLPISRRLRLGTGHCVDDAQRRKRHNIMKRIDRPPEESLQSHTVAAGQTGRITRGRSLAETALRAFVEDWREQSDRQNGDD